MSQIHGTPETSKDPVTDSKRETQLQNRVAIDEPFNNSPTSETVIALSKSAWNVAALKPRLRIFLSQK
jgi:hypothetical protein